MDAALCALIVLNGGVAALTSIFDEATETHRRVVGRLASLDWSGASQI